ncbi:MAG: hypothetical protein Q9160_000952 [Pyrenula sp. 1 TL-2023]
MYDEWFQYELAPDGNVEDGVHPEEARALQSFLEEQSTPYEAATAITKPIERSQTPGPDLARLWGFLVDALLQLPPELLGLLFDLLQAIENLPAPDFPTVKPQYLPDEGELWHTLPGFGHLYADECKWGHDDYQNKAMSLVALRTRQLRKAYVEAQLAVRGIGGIDITWGYECVADALERPIHDSATLDTEISAAAVWIDVAGILFRAGAKKNEECWALELHRELWKGGDTMTWERWCFWKSRFEELKGMGGSIADAAEKALESM